MPVNTISKSIRRERHLTSNHRNDATANQFMVQKTWLVKSQVSQEMGSHPIALNCSSQRTRCILSMHVSVDNDFKTWWSVTRKSRFWLFLTKIWIQDNTRQIQCRTERNQTSRIQLNRNRPEHNGTQQNNLKLPRGQQHKFNRMEWTKMEEMTTSQSKKQSDKHYSRYAQEQTREMRWEEMKNRTK